MPFSSRAARGGSTGEVISIAHCAVSPGDVVVGDGDGVVIVPRKDLAGVLAGARARDAKEQHVFEQLEQGESTLSLYGMDGA